MFKPLLASLNSFIVITALVLISSGFAMADDVPPIIDETDDISTSGKNANYTRSADSIDMSSTTQDSITKENIVKDSVVIESITKDKAPKDSIANDSITKESIVKNSVVMDSITKDKAPKDSIVNDSITKESVVKDSVVMDSIAKANVTKDIDTKESTPISSKTRDNSKEVQSNQVASTAWRNFTSLIGVSDNRPVIPPVEIKHPETVSNQDYVVGPGDQLGISVWRDDSLTRTVVVLHDGKIHYPLLGEIVAGGKTISQLRNEFREKLADYVIDADITVEVKQSNSMLIYLIGKVNSPGRQMLSAETTVLQALAIAGGLNAFAEKDDIKIFRQDKGRTTVYSFRYSQVANGEQLNDNIVLKRGDVIVVP